jgi:chemotaxis protein methyltransferase CheR
MNINPADYEFLSNFLLKTSGLALGERKEYLLEARLVPLAQSSGLDGLGELVAELRNETNHLLNAADTEAMTTNETSFLRDKAPFDGLKDTLIPALISSRAAQRRLRIWCVAASTGQEPYSIAMTLRESFPELQSWNVEIIATDISSKVLDRAREGMYSHFEVQRGLPIQLLMKYFAQVEKGWQIHKELRAAIDFGELNLLDDFSRLGLFDVIFCCNVLIYFENEMKKNILDRLNSMLSIDGYLLLGAAETVLGITDTFQRFRDCTAAVYSPVAAISASN